MRFARSDWPQGRSVSTVRCEDGGVEDRGPGEEDVGEGRDERYLPAEVSAGDYLEEDEDKREVDDREPEERSQGLQHPVAVEIGVLEGVDADDEHREVGRGEVAHVGDDTGACRHPGDGPGIGEHHEDGGEGEEGEEPCVPGADPGRPAAEEGEEREWRDLEERGGASPERGV